MSYINFSLTRTYGGDGLSEVLPSSETISAGFSREGGQVEFVSSASSSDPLAAPHTVEHELTPAILRAASGVRDAVQAAGWVQDVTVQQGDGAHPDVVSWTMRDGGTGVGEAGRLPVQLQQVIDAAALLEQAAFAPTERI